MQNVESNGFGVHSEDHRIDCLNHDKEKEVMGDLHQENIGDDRNSSQGYSEGKDDSTVLNIFICNGDSLNQAPESSELRGSGSGSGSVISNGEPCNEVPLASEQNGEPCGSTTVSQEVNLNALRITGTNKDEVSVAVTSPKKVSLSRSGSSHDDCRVCQQQSEEPLIDLGCRCRGGLARAHLSCINTWFSTRGSNKCEICQEVAVNVPPPESHPSRNYWIWRINPSGGIAREQSRGCYSPLWVALSILIGGLLLDVLISISLGVSALPVNIIIGVLVVLGLGTAFRLALECCQEISMRRAIHRVDANVNPDFHPSIWQNL